MGWGWCRKVPTLRGKLRGQTIHIRLAGIDAPECGHFGNAAQPYSSEALAWLQSYVGGRRVRCYIHSKDQYDRVVATVYVWRGLWRRDVSLEMLKAGMAVVYEGKMNVEFGGKKKEMVYRETEKKAMAAKMGLWKQPKRLRVSPGQYKAALKEAARAAS
ncbi:hypothetical protein BZA77DRAFT_315997 [Pyronema omphalodes]|nr:hypothetical protein BZA77DRAFT_315997 [Pyronema omphalodes]